MTEITFTIENDTAFETSGQITFTIENETDFEIVED